MATKTAKLHLMHASLYVGNTDKAVEQDLEFIFGLNPDIVSFTELYGGNAAVLQRVARNADFQPVVFANAIGEGFAINRSTGVRLKDKDSVKAHSGEEGPNGFPARHINSIKVNFEEEDLWYSTGHWIAHLNDAALRVARHNDMTRVMATQVRKHGANKNLSFFSGDLNEDDKQGEDNLLGNMNTVFPQQGLLTIWDEFRVYPGTFGGRTIDVIGSYKNDERVKAARYKVHPKQNSDHRFVSAWYDITQKKKGLGNGGGGNDGGGGGTGVNPHEDDIYATGGNVDLSDYQDNKRYKYQQATDDSDGPEHGDTID